MHRLPGRLVERPLRRAAAISSTNGTVSWRGISLTEASTQAPVRGSGYASPPSSGSHEHSPASSVAGRVVEIAANSSLCHLAGSPLAWRSKSASWRGPGDLTAPAETGTTGQSSLPAGATTGRGGRAVEAGHGKLGHVLLEWGKWPLPCRQLAAEEASAAASSRAAARKMAEPAGPRGSLGGILGWGAPQHALSWTAAPGGASWQRAVQTAATAASDRGAVLDPGQPTPESHPDVLAAGEITLGVPAGEFAARRAAAMARLPPGSVLMVAAGAVKRMAGVVPYPFRQDADYL